MEVRIEPRYRGFEEVALGGYVGGLLADGRAGGEVKLRRPVPLGRALELEERAGGVRELLEGAAVLARFRPAGPQVAVPAPVSPGEGAAASARSLQRSGIRHPFPGCFTCGDGRAAGDGLRLFAGPVEGRALVAAAWTPSPAFADAAGEVRPEVVWSALDCPTIMAAVFAAPADAPDRVVTRQLAVARLGPVRAGAPHAVMAWLEAREGRVTVTAGAVVDGGGSILAVARHTLALAGWGVPLGRARW